MQVFHCAVAMDEGTFMNACMSSLEVCWRGEVVVVGLLTQHQQPFTPPRVGDPQVSGHASTGYPLQQGHGAGRCSEIQLHPTPPIQTLPDKGQHWQEELMTTCQGALDSHFGRQINHLNSVTWME